MARQLTFRVFRKMAPELRRALPVAILLNSLLLLFAAFVLDGGHLLFITLITTVAFWAWFAFIVFLRGEHPLKLDIAAVKWGFPIVWFAVLYINLWLPDAAFLPAH